MKLEFCSAAAGREILGFGAKQLQAAFFALLLLGAIVLTRNHPEVIGIHRSDFLFLYAVGVQVALVVLRLEHWKEVAVIVAFHILAMLMECFKTSPEIGSWRYHHEEAFFRVYQVPLYAGFLYSAVGSYIARAWRLFELRFENYPPVLWTVVVAVAAYVNFYTHHFVADIRWVLIAASMVMFWKCRVYFKVGERERRMRLLPALIAVATAIWVAENIATYAKAWAYPNQEEGWEWVHYGKINAWYLLMLLSFVLVSLVQLRSLRGRENS